MQTLDLNCPYCGHETSIDHDGLYSPRYHDCADCGKRYIYEPVSSGVDFYRMGEAPCCSDPDCREVEMSGHCEQ